MNFTTFFAYSITPSASRNAYSNMTSVMTRKLKDFYRNQKDVGL